MSCPKCTGLLISGSFQADDVLYMTEMFWCLNCGYIEDDIILRNRSSSIKRPESRSRVRKRVLTIAL